MAASSQWPVTPACKDSSKGPSWFALTLFVRLHLASHSLFAKRVEEKLAAGGAVTSKAAMAAAEVALRELVSERRGDAKARTDVGDAEPEEVREKRSEAEDRRDDGAAETEEAGVTLAAKEGQGLGATDLDMDELEAFEKLIAVFGARARAEALRALPTGETIDGKEHDTEKTEAREARAREAVLLEHEMPAPRLWPSMLALPPPVQNTKEKGRDDPSQEVFDRQDGSLPEMNTWELKNQWQETGTSDHDMAVWRPGSTNLFLKPNASIEIEREERSKRRNAARKRVLAQPKPVAYTLTETGGSRSKTGGRQPV